MVMFQISWMKLVEIQFICNDSGLNCDLCVEKL